MSFFNAATPIDMDAFKVTDKLKQFMRENEFPDTFLRTLEQHGYFDLDFIAGLKVEVRFKNFGYNLGFLVCFLV